MKLREANQRDFSSLKKIYFSAFPNGERKPWWFILQLIKKEKSIMLALDESESEKNIGVIVAHKQGDDVLVDYFAIAENKRRGGLGSEALSLLDDFFVRKTIIVEVEEPTKFSEDNELRKSRIAFYERNGFERADIAVKLFGCHFILMSKNGKISYERYHDILEKTVGTFLKGNISRKGMEK